MSRDGDPIAPLGLAALGLDEDTARLADEVVARIARNAPARDHDGDPEHGLRADVRELALLGVTAARLPRSAGGAGLDYPGLVELQILLARADSNATQALRTHLTLSDRTARALARGEDTPWAERIAAGELVAGATTETGDGASGSVGTSLVRDASGGWRLTGVKGYATGTGFADWVRVLASDEDGRHRVATVRVDSPGVELADDWDGVGQRLTTSGTARFTDVAVAEDAVDLGEGSASDRLGNHDAVLQLTHLATLAGIALRVRDDAVGWLNGRRRGFSHASTAVPADDPQIQERVGTLEGLAQAAVVSVREAARLLAADLDRPAAEQTLDGHLAVTRAQLLVPALTLQAAQSVFEIGGGSLVDARLGLDRHWRNARTLSNHNPVHLKARALGDRALRGGTLPEIWYVGTRKDGA
ncbi:acyl-CoA dehydrogenase family protein [Mycetocola reblochoni]|uniref:Acyl-CoA dehydrogenase C-terminal domain-containing protein n=2 Tax=Mycetocola reblochoni TaxID=331618 RepID=A0A3L6ZV26_9MICO|nr:acyl-CoA dehydrogenase family protein [Mycetocola reblochoni]RLP70912.1 hypothetical protein D9V30_00305 [Mycetocola reblochoni]SJN24567.1 Acyl-CoA dehydrogenase; probable dibenzothiophene desulfurization enzyme [Mycetocola reblochoni REB411]